MRFTSRGQLVVSEFADPRVRNLDLTTGSFISVAGARARYKSSGDGGPAVDAGIELYCIFLDNHDNLFICERDRIRRVDAITGIITTVAGNGTQGFSGDGGPALAAQINPHSGAVDADGNVYFADEYPSCYRCSIAKFQCRIRRVDAKTGTIQTIAGNGNWVYGTGAWMGTGEPALEAELGGPNALAFDHFGRLLFLDAGNRVARIDLATGRLFSVAGDGRSASTGDGGPATRARFGAWDMVLDQEDNIYLAEWQDSRIRRIDAKTGIITTYGGNGRPVQPPMVIR